MGDAFDQAVASLEEAQGFRVEDAGTDLVLLSMSMGDIGEEATRPGIASFMGAMTDLGVAIFVRYVEVIHFPPGTAKNALLTHYVLRWQGGPWALISFPSDMVHPKVIGRAFTACELVVTPTLYAKAFDNAPLSEGSKPADTRGAFGAGLVMPDFPNDRILYLTSLPGSMIHGIDPNDAIALVERRLKVTIKMRSR